LRVKFRMKFIIIWIIFSSATGQIMSAGIHRSLNIMDESPVLDRKNCEEIARSLRRLKNLDIADRGLVRHSFECIKVPQQGTWPVALVRPV